MCIAWWVNNFTRVSASVNAVRTLCATTCLEHWKRSLSRDLPRTWQFLCSRGSSSRLRSSCIFGALIPRQTVAYYTISPKTNTKTCSSKCTNLGLISNQIQKWTAQKKRTIHAILFNNIHETNIYQNTDRNLQKLNLAHRAYESLHFVRNTNSSDTRTHNGHWKIRTTMANPKVT